MTAVSSTADLVHALLAALPDALALCAADLSACHANRALRELLALGENGARDGELLSALRAADQAAARFSLSWGGEAFEVERLDLGAMGGAWCLLEVRVPGSPAAREAGLRRDLAWFERMSEAMGAAVFVYQGEVFVYVNRAACEISGYSREELLGMPFYELVHPEERLLVHARGLARQRGVPLPSRYEMRILHKSGEVRWLDFSATRIDWAGRSAGLGTAVDVTEKKRAEAEVAAQQRRMVHFLTAGQTILYECTVQDGRLVPAWVSDNVERLLGYRLDEALAPDWWVKHLDPRDRMQALARQETLWHTGHLRHVYRFRRKDGGVLWLDDDLRLLYDQAGGSVLAVGAWTDVSEIMENQARIHHLAFHDALTGLPNRVALRDRLRHLVRWATGERRPLAVLLIDLEHLREINEAEGHEAGDLVVRAVAGRLEEALEDGAFAARTDGDEFVVVLPDADGERAARALERLRAAVELPVDTPGSRVTVRLKAGIVVGPVEGKTPETLLSMAGVALDAARREGVSHVFYTPELGHRFDRSVRLARRLEDALQTGEGLWLVFQPVVDLRDGRVEGAEALLRWRDAELGEVAPMEFIAVAEARGLATRLGSFVFGRACAQLAAWTRAGYRLPGRLAVNVSVHQFVEPDLPQRLARIAASHGVDPGSLLLEVTETALARAEDDAAEILRELVTQGFEVAVDDFGTGYSSLARLTRFPVHKLKIDLSFVRDMGHDARAREVVVTIIAMAGALGLVSLAEGVESEAQAAALRATGCRQAQGFWFGLPLPPDEFARRFLQSSPQ